MKKKNELQSSILETPLGTMIAVADEHVLYLLEFTDRPGLVAKLERLYKELRSTAIAGQTKPIESIEQELKAYFSGTLRKFTTPLGILGRPFAQSTWHALTKIPYGQTCSYTDIAVALDQPRAVRAIANGIGTNQIAMVIPCHRVVNKNGNLGGYAGGIDRKKWLLNHEK